jgi:hypothetical protein
MRAYNYGGVQGTLIKSEKTGWQSGQTPHDMLFVHGTGVDPSTAHLTGLTPDKATEFLVYHFIQSDPLAKPNPLEGTRISGGKMLFAFKVCDGDHQVGEPEKSPAVQQLWGLDGHMYVFKVPAGTTYWSMNGAITPFAEVAFEYIVESADIVSYWGPSKNYVYKMGEPKNTRKKFMVASWQQYLVARRG